MTLYHVTLTSSKGLVHKIGITENLQQRMVSYKIALPHETVELVKTRTFNSIDEAYEVEQSICKQFEPVGGREYFLLDDGNLKQFNMLFSSGDDTYDETCAGDNKYETESTESMSDEELKENHNILKNLYQDCYTLLHDLKQANHYISIQLGKQLNIKKKKPRKIRIKPKLGDKIDQMVKLDKAKEVIENIEIGRAYTKEEFEDITSEWIKEVEDWYPELKLNHTTIKVLNEFCSRIGYMWEVKRCGRAPTQYRVYTLSRIVKVAD